jgi:hypothetical protein
MNETQYYTILAASLAGVLTNAAFVLRLGGRIARAL